MEVALVARDNRKVVTQGCCGDVAVFKRHGLTLLPKLMAQLSPGIGYANAKAVNPTFHRPDKVGEPFPKPSLLDSVFARYPVCQLRDNHRARVTDMTLAR